LRHTIPEADGLAFGFPTCHQRSHARVRCCGELIAATWIVWHTRVRSASAISTHLFLGSTRLKLCWPAAHVGC